MSEVEEEARALLYRQQRASRARAWIVNHRVTLAPAKGSLAALRSKWDLVFRAQLEQGITEPLEPPFVTEFEDPPYPIPKRYRPLP